MIQGLPTTFSLRGRCHMVLVRDEEEGMAGGIATSNPVFGAPAGSFQNLRVIREQGMQGEERGRIASCRCVAPVFCFLVGKEGFEPSASCSRSMRAARLRHFPPG